MKGIGAHVSASGGVENAPVNAHDIGATAFALFTKNQRQWTSPPLFETSIEKFSQNCQELGYHQDFILPHDSYLINLGNPTEESLNKSRQAFLDELQRCEQLGLKYLNFHPGSHLKQMSEMECLLRIADSINWALDLTHKVIAVVENTAGQGSNVGYSFEHLKTIIDNIDDKNRIGVCIDTAHTFAAGYDIKTEQGYSKTFELFDHIIGFHYLKGFHLNDSKKALGSRVDRHDSLGEGALGLKVFERIMQDPRFEDIPMVLETPDTSLWPQEISILKKFAGY